MISITQIKNVFQYFQYIINNVPVTIVSVLLLKEFLTCPKMYSAKNN